MERGIIMGQMKEEYLNNILANQPLDDSYEQLNAEYLWESRDE